MEVVGICAGDGKVMDGAERFWGKPGNKRLFKSSVAQDKSVTTSSLQKLKSADKSGLSNGIVHEFLSPGVLGSKLKALKTLIVK